MHIPAVFTEENFDNIIEFTKDHPLATLVAQTRDVIEACHIPLFWHNDHSHTISDADIGSGLTSNKSHGYLYGHFGRKNPIYQDALTDSSWLIIFQDSGH